MIRCYAVWLTSLSGLTTLLTTPRSNTGSNKDFLPLKGFINVHLIINAKWGHINKYILPLLCVWSQIKSWTELIDVMHAKLTINWYWLCLLCSYVLLGFAGVASGFMLFQGRQLIISKNTRAWYWPADEKEGRTNHDLLASGQTWHIVALRHFWNILAPL